MSAEMNAPMNEDLNAAASANALIPLTDGQESLYILSRLASHLPVYNMPFAFRIRGPLHLRAFMEALRLLVARHNALRAQIVETESGLRQRVLSSAEAAFEFHDLSKTDPEQRDSEFKSELNSRAAAPFDLLRQTPFRTDLFKLAEDDHAVLFNLHHTFGDMSAIRILFRDFQELYSATQAGRAPSLPEIGVQMDEFAVRGAGDKPSEATLKFWRERLNGFTSELELPGDSARPAMPSFRGAAHSLLIPAAVANTVKTLARANKCSPYMAFLAVFQTLIYRYTNQEQFVVATPFSQRVDPELENTVGYLISLLPIASAINPRASFRELLAEVRKTTLDALAHENVSLRRILQATNVAADNPRNALSRVVFCRGQPSQCAQSRCVPIFRGRAGSPDA
jgi:hypothetical protein